MKDLLLRWSSDPKRQPPQGVDGLRFLPRSLATEVSAARSAPGVLPGLWPARTQGSQPRAVANGAELGR